MLLTQTIKTSLKNLRVQKMRSFLTMLGIIIGISSVIIVMSVVAGAESLITNQIEGLGSNLLGILPGKAEEDGPPAAVYGIIITTLKLEDAEAIKKLPHVEGTAAYVTATETANWKNQKTTASITGTNPDYLIISDGNVDQGHFFTDEDVKAQSRVAVLGPQVVDDLFNGINPLGEKIKISKDNYTIIGTMETQGTVGFQNVDNMIFIPVTTVQNRIVGIKHIGFARAKIDDEKHTDETIIEVEELLRDRHNISDPSRDDFTVASTKQAAETLGTITSALQFFLVAIAAISLLVGGIGIMNIMLASVTERVKEIGLRKAVGAKKNSIISQFLAETVVLTLTGAIIGVIIGVSFSFIISLIINHLGYDWDFVITLTSITLSCGVSIIIGVVFGLYPANKAAKFDPIEALQYE